MSQYQTNVHLYKILEEIRTRTPMYLETPSISELRTFLDGFATACYTFGLKEEVRDTLLPLPFAGFFTGYVGCRFRSGASRGWWRMILNQTAQDEEKGFQLFYTLLDEFKQLRISKCFAADLSEANIAYHNTDESAPKMFIEHVTNGHRHTEGPLSLYKNPVKVLYAELTDEAKYKSYIGVIETDTESVVAGQPWLLFKNKKEILEYFGMCFGTIAWQKQNQENIPLRSAH